MKIRKIKVFFLFILFLLITSACFLIFPLSSCSWLFPSTDWKLLSNNYYLKQNQSATINVVNKLTNAASHTPGDLIYEIKEGENFATNNNVKIRSNSTSTLIVDYKKYVTGEDSVLTIDVYGESNPSYHQEISIILASKDNAYYAEYIYDITYSVTFVSGGSGASGTCWLLSRIGSTGYQYYMATNDHVTNAMNYSSANVYFAYSPSLFSSSNVGIAPYFQASSVSIENKSKFFTSTYGIDLSIFSVNFGSSPNSGVKQRLDRYNTGGSAYADFLTAGVEFEDATDENVTKNKISTAIKPGMTRVNTSATTGTISASSAFVIGGYPHSDNGTVQWETHSVLPTELSNTTNSRHQTYENSGDGVGGIDSSDQYIFNNDNPYQTGWMDHGASGSILINNNYEAVAIYWGGFETENGSDYYPRASSLNHIFDINGNDQFLLSGQRVS